MVAVDGARPPSRQTEMVAIIIGKWLEEEGSATTAVGTAPWMIVPMMPSKTNSSSIINNGEEVARVEEGEERPRERPHAPPAPTAIRLQQLAPEGEGEGSSSTQTAMAATHRRRRFRRVPIGPATTSSAMMMTTIPTMATRAKSIQSINDNSRTKLLLLRAAEVLDLPQKTTPTISPAAAMALLLLITMMIISTIGTHRPAVTPPFTTPTVITATAGASSQLPDIKAAEEKGEEPTIIGRLPTITAVTP